MGKLVPSTMKVHAMLVPDRIAVATLSPREAAELCWVSTYSSVDPDSPAPDGHGYQRDPEPSRAPAIARYFMAGDNRYLITPIVAAVRLKDTADIEEFVQLFNRGRIADLHTRWSRQVVSIVDGQHRSLGLVHAWRQSDSFSPAVPLMLYFGLDFYREAELFDVVNVTQRKLPRSLLEVTKADILQANGGSESYADRIRRLSIELARSQDSPFQGRVAMTGVRKPETPVSFEVVHRVIATLLPAELLGRIDAMQQDPVALANCYWAGVASACPVAWNYQRPSVRSRERSKLVLMSALGLEALGRLGRDVISSALEAELPRVRIVDLTSRLHPVDWRSDPDNPWALVGGFVIRSRLYSQLHALVYSDRMP